MTYVEWRPLSERLGVVPSVWREEVPAALVRPLRNWVYDAMDVERSDWLPAHWKLVERVSLRLNVETPGPPEHNDTEASARIAEQFADDTDTGSLPDLVDAILDVLASPTISDYGENVPKVKDWRSRLEQLLDDARSALRVREDGRGLERRADVAAEAAFVAAVGNAKAASGAGSAAEHLWAAWECVHALRPVPGNAYFEAVKAVEAAAHSVVYPDGDRQARLATLGKMLQYLREHQKEFSLVIAGRDRQRHVGRLIGCLELLWYGETDRHGSREPTRVVSLDEAVMAVHLAVMLVQWFTSGAVRRVDG
jgi:hypothetical protein